MWNDTAVCLAALAVKEVGGTSTDLKKINRILFKIPEEKSSNENTLQSKIRRQGKAIFKKATIKGE